MWTLYGELLYAVQTVTDSRNFWYSGVVLNRKISEQLELGLELFGNSKKQADDHSNAAFNFGGILKLSERYYLLFSTGRSFRKGPRFAGYFGIQIILKGLNKGGHQNGEVQFEKK